MNHIEAMKKALEALTILGDYAPQAVWEDAVIQDAVYDLSLVVNRVEKQGSVTWVGLTTEEVKTIVDSATYDNDGYDIFTDGTQVAFLVEAKLKEKNT